MITPRLLLMQSGGLPLPKSSPLIPAWGISHPMQSKPLFLYGVLFLNIFLEINKIRGWPPPYLYRYKQNKGVVHPLINTI